MAEYAIQCLTTYEEFSHIKDEWEAFVRRYFPDNYSKTYPWLLGWWKTYLNKGRIFIYIQMDNNGKIVSAAPLFAKWEFFGGLPVCMLKVAGNGLGTDDLLLTQDSKEFISEVFKRILKLNWHIIKLNRATDTLFFNELEATAKKHRLQLSATDCADYLINLPTTYTEYLQSRSKKFRRNLNHAEKLLSKCGCVELVTVDPYKEFDRIHQVGEEIAKTSWQYTAGLSHFNKRNGGTFYSHLIGSGQRAGGEDFNILMVEGRPVAYLLGCRRERIYYAIDTAFHADFKNISVGRILFGRVIERLIMEQQVDTFDFEGDGEYKDHYANTIKQVKSVTIYKNTFYTAVIQRYKNSRFFEQLKNIISKAHSSKKE